MNPIFLSTFLLLLDFFCHHVCLLRYFLKWILIHLKIYLTLKFLSNQFFLLFITLYWSFYLLQYFDDVFFFHFATFCQSAFFQHTSASFLFSFFFIIFLSFFCCHFFWYLFFCVQVLIVFKKKFVISNLAFLQFVWRLDHSFQILFYFLTISFFFHFILSIFCPCFFSILCNNDLASKKLCTKTYEYFADEPYFEGLF